MSGIGRVVPNPSNIGYGETKETDSATLLLAEMLRSDRVAPDPNSRRLSEPVQTFFPRNSLGNATKQNDAIVLIDFEVFKRFGSFPRYPDQKHLCITLDRIDTSSSYIVFVSHTWLRSLPGCVGWDGKPHPDVTTGEKYKIIVEGISKAWKIFAPGLANCFLWIDFCCIDQDEVPDISLQFENILKISDIIFTPIYDPTNSSRSTPPASVLNFYQEFKSSAWSGPQAGYINRSWCRLEMFYAANIPTDHTESRINRFSRGMKHHAAMGLRPHIVYGTKFKTRGPVILAPLQNSLFASLDPRKGFVTKDIDKVIIDKLVNILRMPIIKEEYIGERDKKERMHGHGVMRYANGDYYEGEWKADLKHGRGLYKWAAEGNMYDGDWKNNEIHGKGVFKYAASGNVYNGGYHHGLKHGRGVMTYGDGDVYMGEFSEGVIQGKGEFRFTDGGIQKGVFENGVLVQAESETRRRPMMPRGQGKCIIS